MKTCKVCNQIKEDNKFNGLICFACLKKQQRNKTKDVSSENVSSVSSVSSVSTENVSSVSSENVSTENVSSVSSENVSTENVSSVSTKVVPVQNTKELLIDMIPESEVLRIRALINEGNHRIREINTILSSEKQSLDYFLTCIESGNDVNKYTDKARASKGKIDRLKSERAKLEERIKINKHNNWDKYEEQRCNTIVNDFVSNLTKEEIKDLTSTTCGDLKYVSGKWISIK